MESRQERRAVPVGNDAERLAEIVGELKTLGAIDAEATECD
jgi:hypothetical protein